MKKLMKSMVIVILSMVLIFALVACNTKIIDNYDDAFFDEMKTEDKSLADGANLRVMSANVLVHIKSWGGTPVSPRAEIFAEALQYYAPDVVGVQEFCDCFYKEMPKRAPEYKLLTDKKSDYTSIMYNSNTVKLIDSGIKRYSKHSNKNCRFVVWGVFEKLNSGEKFAVTSTHWDFGMEDEKIAMRAAQIKEQSEVIDMLIEKFKVPVFAVGDFNVYENTDKDGAQSYRDLLEVAKVVDSKIQLGKAGTILGATNNIMKFETESWDHIFIKGKIEPKRFNILYNTKYYESLSDHPLIYLDAKI